MSDAIKIAFLCTPLPLRAPASPRPCVKCAVQAGALPPTALLLLALALQLNQLGDLLLQGGDSVFQRAQTTFQPLLARLFAALIFGKRSLLFKHPFA